MSFPFALTPQDLQQCRIEKKANEISKASKDTARQGRIDVCNIFSGIDKRLLVVVGPHSFNNVRELRRYAYIVQEHRFRIKEKLRIMFCVPPLVAKTKVDVTAFKHAVQKATGRGMPIVAHLEEARYLDRLVSFGFARGEAEKSFDPQLPLAFEYSSGDSIAVAVSGVLNAPILQSCVMLKGSALGSNHGPASVEGVVRALRTQCCAPNLLIDCSYRSTEDDYPDQMEILRSVMVQRNEQRKQGSVAIKGVVVRMDSAEDLVQALYELRDMVA